MRTSMIRKTFLNSYGNITIEAESQNTPEDAILISCMNDSMVIDIDAVPKIIEHLQQLVKEMIGDGKTH